VAGPPLLNGRCTSLLRAPVSEMTYTVLSGTLNPSIPYHTIPEVAGLTPRGKLVHNIRLVYLCPVPPEVMAYGAIDV